MYFFDLNGLSDHLRLEKNTQRESLQYLIGFYILEAFGGYIRLGSDGKENSNSFFEMSFGQMVTSAIFAALFLAIGIWVISYFYRANGGDNGKFFLHRILAIGFVLACWATPISLVIVGFMALTQNMIVMGTGVMAFLAMAIYFFFLTSSKLRYISAGIPPKDPPAAEPTLA